MWEKKATTWGLTGFSRAILQQWLRSLLENPASSSQCTVKLFKRDMHAPLMRNFTSNINSQTKPSYLYEDRLAEWKFYRHVWVSCWCRCAHMWWFLCVCVCVCTCASCNQELMGNSEASTRLIIYQESRRQCSHWCFFECTHCDPIRSTLWGTIEASLWSRPLTWHGGNWTVEIY